MRFTPLIWLNLAAATIAAPRAALKEPYDVTLSKPSLLKVPPIVDNQTKAIIFPVVPGTDVSCLTPEFSLPSGVEASPPAGKTLDLSAPVKVTLSLKGSKSTSWQFSAVEMGSPALPGLYADPNIVVFGNTYYIFSTTDGFPGWGGQSFYVWSSPDLVHWKRSAEPILTLNGTSGNVPWAIGNAWAPTIATRYGRYYLYFSGNNPTYDQKTIGAAVADSPEGPWKAEPEAMITNTGSLTVNQAIDPAAFVDPKTGTHYLFWGNGNNPLMAELADDMVSLKNGTTKAVEGLQNFTEASFVVYRKPYYHYTYSYGDTDSANYEVNYATAESVDGPWTSRGNVLYEMPRRGILATGSSSTVNVPGTDDWYMAYHRFHIPNGNGTDREVCLDKIQWSNDGLMEPVNPTLRGVLSPVK